MGASVTALAKLAIGDSDPVDTAIQFATFSPGVLRELKDTNHTRGTFFKDGNRMIENRNTVLPKLATEPTAPEIASLLKWIMGGTPTGSGTVTYPWSNTALLKYVYFHPNAGEDWFQSGVAVDVATMRANSGEALSFDLSLVGQTYDDTRSDFPSLTYDIALQPFILSQLVLTIGGVQRKCRSFSATINNMIDKTRFLNSLTLTAVNKLGAVFGFSCEVPSGDNSGLWKTGIAGASASAVFTNPSTGAHLDITWPKLKFPGKNPEHEANAEGFLSIEAEAVRVAQGATDYPITITLTQ